MLRTGFNPHSDLSSILAKSAEPVRTPSARTGPLAGMHFDIAVMTAPDITVQSALAQGIQAEGELRLRGTLSNPALQGRINITEGEIVFFGTKYRINEGSVSFFNPVRIEPILNVDLETKARGIDVTLTVSGPVNKLNLTPRSDPPLQFQEIIALLATGRAPTSDPTLLARESTSPQTWQQMGASALVGQAIANPVSGRLQRFFGVTKLKIDPTLTGRGEQPAGAPHDRTAGDARHHVHLHHQRDEQQSTGGACGVGVQPAMVGGGAPRGERDVRTGLLLQEAVPVAVDPAGGAEGMTEAVP